MAANANVVNQLERSLATARNNRTRANREVQVFTKEARRLGYELSRQKFLARLLVAKCPLMDSVLYFDRQGDYWLKLPIKNVDRFNGSYWHSGRYGYAAKF